MSTLTKRQRLRRRIRRVERRINRIESRIETLEDVDALNLRGPLKAWVDRAMAEDPDFFENTDTDDDGKIDFEELVEFLQDSADAFIEPRNPIFELISDAGLEVVAWIAVAIYRGTEKRLERRLTRNQRLRRRLQERLADTPET